MHPADEELIVRYVESGDEIAFRTLVERHQEKVFGYLMGMVKDRDAANDLFQETYVRVIRALAAERGSYSHQGKWINWVMRIARNAALDHLRSRKKWADVSSNAEDGPDYWDRLEDNHPGADVSLALSEDVECLKECILQLAPEQREVLLLRHESELTFREIAELTNCSINTALGRMRYALLNLRQMMSEARASDQAAVSRLTQ